MLTKKIANEPKTFGNIEVAKHQNPKKGRWLL